MINVNFIAAASSAAPTTVATPAVRMVPVQITVPPQQGVPNSTAKSITVQVPAHALQGIFNIWPIISLTNYLMIQAVLRVPNYRLCSVLRQLQRHSPYPWN